MNDVEPTLIYETVHGSRAYGLGRPDSDEDLKGIIIGPASWYHGFRGGPEQFEISPDHVRYEVRKFFRLAAGANPTVLELLWTEADDVRVLAAAGKRLVDARDQFLSKRVASSFGRYALAQLKRIQTHRRWLLSPPKAEPTRSAFGLPERTLIPGDQLGAAEALIAQGRLEEAELTPNFIAVLDRERRYRQARTEWEQYRNWQRTRNPTRAELEGRFGYDTKHAMHMVRLLRMGAEILSTRRVVVRRPDRDELLAIRAGAWSYDELMARAQELSQKVEHAAVDSVLPEEPDALALDAFCASLVEEVLAC
ncbi:MAG: nucleotidyltransferase domain-containing protein [Deltaproteobacteria bacterium]|nr:nucleotidyltransferase domain-containing protein [Deltaproteobacteria bacterium]